MNKNEKMYEAITGIEDDIIESAGEYRFEKRKRRLSWVGVAAAACLALGLGAFGVSRLVKSPAAPYEAHLPTEAPSVVTAEPVDNDPTFAPEQDRIVLYATDKTNFENESIPNAGAIMVSPNLSRTIEPPENTGNCLFAVTIGLFHTNDDVWHELNVEYHECIADPDYLDYSDRYSAWERENYMLMTAEEIAAHYGLTYPEFDDRPNYPTTGYLLMHEDFETYLKEQVDAEEYARCIAAQERMKAVCDEMDGSRTRMKAAYNAARDAEFERLAALGFDVQIEDGVLIGFLTADQILNFPCTEEYGYQIIWIGNESVMDE